MKFIKNFMAQEDSTISISRYSNGPSIFSSYSGISSDTAQRIVDVFGCINIKANALAIMPLKLYRKTNIGKEELTSHTLFPLLKSAPNPELTAFEWKKMIVQDLDLRGNHYVQIVRNGLGHIVALYPLVADGMTVEWTTTGNQKIYKYYGQIIPSSRLLHFFDIPDKEGLKGISRIQLHKDTFEFSKSASLFGNKLFKNGVTPTGVFETPSKLDDASFNRLKKDLEEEYSGLEKSGKPMLLEEGLTYKAISLTSSDAQWIESRKLNRENIATIFGVPSAMLNDTANTAYNNLEQKWLEFQTNTILPICIAIEQKSELKLLGESEKAYAFFKFTFNSLLRVDAKSRAEYYRTMFNMASMSPNEIRALEDMNSYNGGDEYFMQTANATVENIIKVTQ